MKEGDILFYKTKGDNDWIGIFDHISDERYPGVFNKVALTEDGHMYTPIREYVERGSYGLCRLEDLQGFRAANPDEIQLLESVLEKNGYHYDEWSKKLKKGPKKPEFKYGDFIYCKTVQDYEWLSIFRGNSPDEILSLVDYDPKDKAFYTSPEYPSGRLVCHTQVKECRLMTPEEKQTLIDALARQGYTWNEEKWELEVLKKEHEFKPFEKVLVRDRDTNPWHADLFGYVEEDNGINYKVRTISSWYKQCIPYEGNEKLLGTTDKPE